MGKVIQCSLLTATELNKLTSEVANVDVSKCVYIADFCYAMWSGVHKYSLPAKRGQ